MKIGDDIYIHIPDEKTKLETVRKDLEKNEVVKRLWDHDFTLWKPDPEEISNRLGWLHSPSYMQDKIQEIESFVHSVRKDGFTQVLLLGMGGSSLAPEVFRKTFGVQENYLDLLVLDSTDPGAVLEYQANLNVEKTLYIVSTKSGTTVETLSFMKYFYNQVLKEIGEESAGSHFVAITDPGSALESKANELNFRKSFLNDPDVGGRYSALTFFGLVPAGLLGVDLTRLLQKAKNMAISSQTNEYLEAEANRAVLLGGLIGKFAESGRNKLTFIISEQIRHFGTWVEQLIAESTGKEGKGILPVEGEAVLDPEYYATDRIFIYLRLGLDSASDERVKKLNDAGQPVIIINLNDKYDLGGEFFHWEILTATAGWQLGINPFDQPNVESAKKQARKMVDTYRSDGKLPELRVSLTSDGMKIYSEFSADNLSQALDKFFAQGNFKETGTRNRSYIALQAYLKPDAEIDSYLQRLRNALQKKYKAATTVGYGPRFLHSTGQLHKGDAGDGLFIQFTSDMDKDCPIPDEPGKDSSSITFGILKEAQSLGDRQALLDEGRKIIRFHLGGNIESNLRKITDVLT